MAWARKPIAAAAAAGLCTALALPFAPQAFATERDDLNQQYQMALVNYESIVAEQNQNAEDITKVEAEVKKTEKELADSREQLSATVTSLYKKTRDNNDLIEYVLSSSSFHEAVMRYDTYERIERYYDEQIGVLVNEKQKLDERKAELEQRREQIAQAVEDAKQATVRAETALRNNIHADGAKYHQVQGTGNNCGATAFIVGVNVLLDENRYLDNVAVWEAPGFNGDSTADIAYRGGIWLATNGLSDQIVAETVAGDIHTIQELRSELEDGKVVIISSGDGSVWQRADGTQTPEGSHPFGHWIVFYSYHDGVFYANDSSIPAELGAGCPYNEEQMQQWLDGRSNHYAVTMKRV